MMDKGANKGMTKGLRSRLQAGNAIVMLFAAIGMAGVVTYSLNNVIRGPAVTTAEVSRRTMAENNLIATTRLAISAATNQQTRGGDCDADGFIEPLPYRLAGGAPAPVGGGLIPTTMGASMSDPWGVQYGYCVWDPGTASVSDAVADCGGATPRRLEGAPRDDQYAIAVISAGKNGVFETSCNAYVDTTPADGVPDTVMLNKPGTSDDIVLAYTYAEANGIGGGEWKLKASDPTTAEIAKNLEIGSSANPRGATFTEGGLTMGGARGLVLPGDPGDDTVTGACTAAKEKQLRRNIGDGSDVPVIEICHATAWVPVTGGTSAGQQCQPTYDTWTAQSGSGSRNWGLIDVSSDGEMMAAITPLTSAAVYYSHNGGTTWAAGNITGLYGGIAVTADGNTMYASNMTQGIRKSTDGGATWGPAVSSGVGGAWGPVDTSFDGTIVASVKNGGQIGVSTDSGATVTLYGSVEEWIDIAMSSNGTRMAAIVNNGHIYTSTDTGATWTQRGSANTWYAITSSANGMKLAAVVSGGKIWTSTDGGVNWAQQAGSPDENWLDITSSSDGTRLVATTETGQVYTSEDSGVTWAARDSNRQWRGVASSADGTKIAAVVYSGNIYTSDGDCPASDGAEAVCGVDWEAKAAPSFLWQALTYGAGKYVAVGQNRTMYSIDGDVWIDAAPPVNANWVDITYGNGMFVTVAAGNATPVMTSTDGLTWTARTADNNQWAAIAYGNGRFVAVARNGTNSVAVSADGITWTPQAAAENNIWMDVAYGNGLFVAISQNGTNRIMTSPDGVTWTPRSAPAANQWSKITYANGQFVAVSFNGANNVMTSPDGVNWTGRTSGISNSWGGLTYGNGQYLAVSSDGTDRVMTSSDAVAWTAHSAAEASAWSDVLYADGKFVAVANGGTNRVMMSRCGAAASDTITAMPHPLEDGLIAYWKLDEGTGSDVEDSLGNYNGAFVNTPIWAADGPHGTSSLNFRKADRDAVQINGLLGQPSEGTIAAWVNIESLDTSGATIFAIGDNISLTVTPSAGLTLNYWSGGSMTSTSATNIYKGDGWHYVVATFSSINDAFRVYVDGTAVGSSTATANVSWSPRGANTFIGRHGNGNTNFDFEGSIDDVRVYGRAFSPNEVGYLTERARNETQVRDKSYSSHTPLRSGQISLGSTHACAINKDSSLWCWGSNVGGKLGNTNFPTSSAVPVSVMTTPSEWSQVAAGTNVTCGLKTDGSRWCWGTETNGQFGNGGTATDASTTPLAVNAGTVWTQISQTSLHGCGITNIGTLYCWGDNTAGKLGNGNTTQQLSITQVGTDQWKYISAGYHHTCGIKKDGSGWCWGSDTNGKLGNGASVTGDQSNPSRIEGNYAWSTISAKSSEHTCGVTTDGKGWCWGAYANGKLGSDIVAADQTAPYPVFGNRQWKEIITENQRSCGITANGEAYCWGLDTNGELGNGTVLTAAQWTPSRVTLPGFVSTMQLGNDFSCAMDENGRVYCWGADASLQLGNGTTLTASQASPSSVPGFPNPLPFIWNSTHSAIRLNPTVLLALGNKWISNDGTAKYFGFDGPGIAKLAQTTSSNQLLLETTFANSSAQIAFRKGDPAVAFVDDTSNAVFWVMNETAGTAVPSSSGGIYPGTISGKAVWNATGGVNSPSLEFDGKTGRVSVANNAAFRPATTYAVSVLIRPDGIQQAGATILSKSYNDGQYDSYALKFTNDQKISFVTTGAGFVQNTVTSAQAVRPNSWTVVTAFSVDAGGGNVRKAIAINNVIGPYTTALAPIYSTNATGNLFFGAAGCIAPCNTFKGGIDAVRIYGVEITSAMYEQLYGFQTTSFASPKSIGVDHTTNSLEIGTSNAAASNWLSTIAPEFSLTNTGTIGIGTTSPEAKVDVNGGVRIGYQTTCNAAATGTMRYTGNSRDALSVNTAETCLPRLGIGIFHGCAIGKNTRAYCWGRGAQGRLGDGNTTASNIPVASVNGAGPGTYKSIATSKIQNAGAGAHFACGLGTDSRVYCWGNNSNGQIGDGTGVTPRLTPTLTVNGAGPGTYKYLSVGTYHACGIGTDDRAYCWGENTSGQLGDNTVNARTSPVLVLNGAGPGTYLSIFAGRNTTCGIGTDYRAYCWGENGSRQLADGSIVDKYVPTLANTGAGPGTYTSISVGEDHVCAIGTDTKGYCWGPGTDGILGDGTATMRTAPALVVNGASNGAFMTISTGRTHTCALGWDKKAYCWGNNTYAQIGDGTTTVQNSPVLVLNGDGPGTYKELVAGERATCGIGTDDRLYCWGDNADSKLADGTNTQRAFPTLALSGYGTGRYDGCASETAGSFEFCNGTNWEVIDGTATTSNPTRWSKKDNALTTQNSTCAIRTDGSLWCWGNDTNERNGNGAATGAYVSPERVLGTDPWNLVTAGDNHTCGIRNNGTAWCWGGDANGQVGNGATSGNIDTPAQISGSDTWVDLSGGYRHTCGIKSDGTAWCWGEDGSGQLGNGAPLTGTTSPAQVTGTGTWVDVEAGVLSSCGIKNDGTAWCWGSDSSGQLGNGATAGTQSSPTQVTGTGTWVDVAVGDLHACGIKNDGTAWCWGSDANGELGNGATAGNQISPTQVSGTGTWVRIDAGHTHSCGIKNDGTAWCWGSDADGQLGNGATTGNQISPVQINAGGTWTNIVAGERTTCATKMDGSNWCWGSDTNGELGNGAALTGTQVSPTLVE